MYFEIYGLTKIKHHHIITTQNFIESTKTLPYFIILEVFF